MTAAGALDEFGEIARLFAPLTGGAPEALGLLDDAAVLRPPSGEELVITTDAMVAGVHFLPDTPPDVVARRLLRTNLSDLAAKAAEPWLWWLTVAWPPGYGASQREAFAAGLAEDQVRYGLRLAGGDTVRTAGPLTVSATLAGRAPTGATVRRAGAAPGDVVLVSGVIGDAGLGLDVLTGALSLPADEAREVVERHRLPEPRLKLRDGLRSHASAAADVSDGLLSDAGAIALASGLAVALVLELMPLSTVARRWVDGSADPAAALTRLATSGDDYEVVCTAPPERVEPLQRAAAEAGETLTVVGAMRAGSGVSASCQGSTLALGRLGYVHR